MANCIFKTLRAFTTHVRNNSCWSCGKNVDIQCSNLFCLSCKALQRPDGKLNYFNLLGLQENYDIDEHSLAKKYKELQRQLHPDKYSHKDRNEQEISEEYSSLVNEAYNTLLQPLTRGIYMLKLKGQEITENTQVDQEFLMDIMEKNEEVENAESEEEIMKLNEENKKKLEELKKNLSNAFFTGNLKEVKRILSYMKYYTSIDTQIQGIIRSKGIIR